MKRNWRSIEFSKQRRNNSKYRFYSRKIVGGRIAKEYMVRHLEEGMLQGMDRGKSSA
jgi:hypothetical protein